jgi:hypothetical protein
MGKARQGKAIDRLAISSLRFDLPVRCEHSSRRPTTHLIDVGACSVVQFGAVWMAEISGFPLLAQAD